MAAMKKWRIKWRSGNGEINKRRRKRYQKASNSIGGNEINGMAKKWHQRRRGISAGNAGVATETQAEMASWHQLARWRQRIIM